MGYDYFKGTKSAFKKEVARHLAAKMSVIIDNTNAKQIDRQQWFEMAPAEYSKLEVFFDLPKQLVMHLNDIRTKELVSIPNIVHDKIPKVPDVAIHTWYKYLEQPSSVEGYSKLFHITIIDVELTKGYRHRHFLEWNC